jgi:membrane protease YdiL (CAAX protease family)
VTRGLLGAGVLLAGFLAGRRGFEGLTYTIQAGGVSTGLAAALAAGLYLAFAAALAQVALLVADQPRDLLIAGRPAADALGQITVGFCLGAAVVLVTLVVEWRSGLAQLSGLAMSSGLVRSLGAGLFELGGIAAAEELVFRVALLTIAVRVTGMRWGIVLSSVAYAAVHAGATWSSPIYLASLFCFGVAACQLRRLGGESAWIPIGAHWAWDFVSFAVFRALPVTLLGPTWLNGLPDHLSAGLVMLGVLALTATATARLAWRTS